MKTNTAIRRQTLRFENLEHRTMLAGNVVSSFSGGCLQLVGDSKANIIALHQLSNGDWEVDGLLKTKIDGQKLNTFQDVRSIKILLNGGTDAVAVFNGELCGDLCIDTGSSSDAVALLNLNLGSVHVTTGTAADLLVAVCVNVGHSTSTTSITTNSVSTTTSLACFDTGDGNDLVLLAQVQSCDLSLCTGKGTDIVGLLDVCVDNCLAVDTGSGLDILAVVHSSANSARFSGGSNSGDILATAINCFDSTSSDFKHSYNFDSIAKSVTSWLKSAKSSLLSQLSSAGNLPNLSDLHL